MFFHGISLFVVASSETPPCRFRLASGLRMMQSIHSSSRDYGHATEYLLRSTCYRVLTEDSNWKIKNRIRGIVINGSEMACRKGGAGARRGCKRNKNRYGLELFTRWQRPIKSDRTAHLPLVTPTGASSRGPRPNEPKGRRAKSVLLGGCERRAVRCLVWGLLPTSGRMKVVWRRSGLFVRGVIGMI